MLGGNRQNLYPARQVVCCQWNATKAGNFRHSVCSNRCTNKRRKLVAPSDMKLRWDEVAIIHSYKGPLCGEVCC